MRMCLFVNFFNGHTTVRVCMRLRVRVRMRMRVYVCVYVFGFVFCACLCLCASICTCACVNVFCVCSCADFLRRSLTFDSQGCIFVGCVAAADTKQHSGLLLCHFRCI